MFSEKYRPKSLAEYVGQKDQKETFLKWIKNWKPGKAIMFHGPPGVGKTTLVEAYAAENKLDLIETNASDFRSAAQLKSTLTSSVTQQSLFKRGKIFLIDEVDGISGYEDKGGVGEMIEMVKTTKHPIVLIANDPYNQKLRSLRQYCQLVEFKKITSWDIQKKLQDIVSKEKISVPKEVISLIGRRAQGDLRSAINDLQTVFRDEKTDYEMFEGVGVRERGTNIFETLRSIFKSESALSAKHSIDNVDKDPDEIFWWVENNIASEYENPEEVARAFEVLSKADMFRRKIHLRQNWKLLAYFIDLMTAGVAMSKDETYRKFTRYQYPSNIMILGRTKVERAASKEILIQMSKELHCSIRKVKREYMPYVKMISENEESKNQIAASPEVEKLQIAD